ncbi:MAG: DUF6088 family protein [Bacteroidales bacterium]|jgi:hypothetical protein|nr:DUF6088 family protein [Bacteroidales bacterium]
MQSIEDKIYIKIKYSGKGKIYFSADFVKYGTPESVTKALNTLCNKKVLIRIARGIYLYPKFSELLNDYAYPSIDEIAKEIAKRDKARIVPTGVQAQNMLGLSTQVPMNAVYLTDGSPRRINIGTGKGILFKHTSPKNLAFKSDLIMLVVFALKDFGEGKVSSIEIEKIKSILLQHETKDSLLKDIELAPAWVRKSLLKMFEI